MSVFSSSVSPVNLFRDLAEVNPMFRGYAQQDSQECLTTFLNVLHEYLKEESFVDDEAEDIDPIEEKTEPDLQQNGSNNTNGHVNSSSPSIPINKRKKSPTTMASSPGSMSPSKASGSPSRRSQMSRENLYATSPRTHCSMSSSTASTSTSSSRSSSKSQTPMEIDTKKEIPKERKKSYKSIISDIFEGTLLSRVQCCNCGNVSSFFSANFSPKEFCAKSSSTRRSLSLTMRSCRYLILEKCSLNSQSAFRVTLRPPKKLPPGSRSLLRKGLRLQRKMDGSDP